MKIPKFFQKKSAAQETLSNLIVSFDLGVSFFQNTIVRILLVLAAFPLVGSFVVLGASIFPTSVPLVLRYNVYFGVSLLGDWWQVYMVPCVGVIFSLFHVFLAKRYYDMRERIASYLILLALSFLGLGIFITSIALAIVNY